MKNLVVLVLFVVAIYVTWSLAKMDAELAQMPAYDWTNTDREWVCTTLLGGEEPTIRAMVDTGGELGRIEVIPLEVTHEGVYHVEGLDHRWDWGKHTERGTFSWSFTIGTDGISHLYDFRTADERGVAQSSDVFMCKKLK